MKTDSMTIPRCYVPQALSPGEVIELPAGVSHHLGHVLRLRTGSDLTLFNGRGGEYTAQLVRIGKKQAQAEVGEHRDIERESPLLLTLAQGISRGQKMDYTIQKAVELGCQRVIPVLNERSSIRLPDERRQKKHEHWQNIVIAACEQCGR
ncbi:MAG: 16S rRNA (uracil(1498)-N(3))-methyltransferase, partial [Gammaproteobacteria bacterium]|nr:16S rRNA (uracil(1498)-N(3))-methyltransferase [Gammaproteobacteria bacterium]